VIFAGSFLYRFLDLSFHNDHFEFISLGAEIVDGAVPGVDFFDPTRPLQYYLSAAGLWLFGHQLLAEAVLSVTLMSIGTALVFVAGARLSNSVTLGILAAVFTAAILPRLYSYPKILIPAVSLLAVWRFIDQPSRLSLAAMCFATAMSFYFRFDHGVWIGMALFAAVVARDVGRWRQMAMHLAVYAGGVMLLCAPFVLFLVAMGGGVSSGPGTGRLTYLLKGEDVVSLQLPKVPAERPLVYLRPAGPQAIVRFTPGVSADQQESVERRYSLRFARFIDEGAARLYVLTDRSSAVLARLKADPIVADVTNVDNQGHILRDPPWSVLRRWLHVPIVESPLLTKMNGAIWLYDALFFTPLVAAALLIVRTQGTTFRRSGRPVRRRTAEGEAPKVIATIVLGVLFNVFLIRDNLDSRLGDVIVPGALLWAWMLRAPWQGLFDRPIRIPALARATGWAVVMLSIWMSVDVYAGSINQLTATEMFSTPLHAVRRLKGAIVNLRQDPLEQFAPAGSTGLRAVTRYINRCTAPTDRLLVLGYQPEMFFYADRRIGGGNAVFHANSGSAPRQQEIIVERLKRERVPVVVLPVDQVGEIENVYPILKTYIDSRYGVAKEDGFGEGRPLRVLVDSQSVVSHIDAELGLPCFVGNWR